MRKKGTYPVVFVSPTGDFVVCTGYLTRPNGEVIGLRPHETLEFAGRTFCRPEGPATFLPEAGSVMEPLGSFFGVSIPQFLGQTQSPEDFLSEFEQEDEERRSRVAGFIPGEYVRWDEDEPKDTLPRMAGHVLLQNHPRQRDRKRLAIKTLHSLRLSTESERLDYLKAGLAQSRVPPVRVWAALTGQSESAAGPERDRLCERILRENPAMTRVSWTRHSSRRSLSTELAPSPEDLKKLLTMPMAPVKPLRRG